MHSAASSSRTVAIGQAGVVANVSTYDSTGRPVDEMTIDGPADVSLPPAGFAVASS